MLENFFTSKAFFPESFFIYVERALAFYEKMLSCTKTGTVNIFGKYVRLYRGCFPKFANGRFKTTSGNFFGKYMKIVHKTHFEVLNRSELRSLK